MKRNFVATAAAATAALALAASAPALSQSCANRGDLDARYCDENSDLIADSPKNAKHLQNPATLIFSYTPVEDPAVYENVFNDFMAHLSKVTGKRVRWFPAESYAAQVEAMRSGRLHIAGVATGPTPYAVNLAGFVPIVAMQRADGSVGYTLQLITHKDSHIRKVADLKGKRVAHVSPSSNSGDIAPRALFKQLGIEPGKDYEVLFSGKHDNSVMGVVNNDYDAAPVASTVARAHASARHVQARYVARRVRIGAVPAHRVPRRAQPHARAPGQDQASVPHLRLQELQARERVQGHRALRRRSTTRSAWRDIRTDSESDRRPLHSGKPVQARHQGGVGRSRPLSRAFGACARSRD